MVTSEKLAVNADATKAVAVATPPVTIKVAAAPVAPAAVQKVAAKVMAKPAAKKAAPRAKAAVKTVLKAPAKTPIKATLKTPAKPLVKPLAKPKLEKLIKAKKPKLVRDSFTIPKAEYTVLDDLKQRATKLARQAKKSELIRAGVKALAAMSDVAFLAALKAVPAIKTGRPSKD
jgi:hypothetical protein